MSNRYEKLTQELLKKIERVRTGCSLVIPYISDLHADNVGDEITMQVCQCLELIAKAVMPDAVVDLGDNLGMLGRNYHISNENLKITLGGVLDRIKGAVKCPLFLINGNHDAVGTDFFVPEIWNEVVKDRYDDALAVYHTDGAYYYVDYEKANTRLVFLSLPCGSDFEAVNPTPLWKYGEKQLDWLRNIAFDTEYDVIIFTHVPYTYKCLRSEDEVMEVWDGSKTAISYVKDLCGRIEDIDDALAIIKAFGRVRMCFSGHTHRCELFMPGEDNGDNTYPNPLLCPQYTIARPSSENIAISVIVWNFDERKMYIFSFDKGEDYELELG